MCEGNDDDGVFGVEGGKRTQMNWKRALMFGSLAGGAVLFLTGRRPAGLALAGIGVATLAAEYPEKLADLWRRLPDYVEKSGKFVDTAANILERLGQHRG